MLFRYSVPIDDYYGEKPFYKHLYIDSHEYPSGERFFELLTRHAEEENSVYERYPERFMGCKPELKEVLDVLQTLEEYPILGCHLRETNSFVNRLADYLRTDDVDAIVQLFIFWADFQKDYYDNDGDWGCYPAYDSVKDVVSCACRSVRDFGYAPKSDWNGSTFNHVMYMLNPPKDHNSDAYCEWEKSLPTEEDKAQAEEVIEWVKNHEHESGYIHNLQVACEMGYVTERTMGLVISAIAAFKKAMGQKTYQEKEQKGGDSEYVGTVGDRIDIEADLTFSKTVESNWGTSWIVVFVDDNGNVFSGFVPFKTLNNIPETAKRFKIRGTIKEHTIYNDVKQTVLNRMKLEGVR